MIIIWRFTQHCLRKTSYNVDLSAENSWSNLLPRCTQNLQSLVCWHSCRCCRVYKEIHTHLHGCTHINIFIWNHTNMCMIVHLWRCMHTHTLNDTIAYYSILLVSAAHGVSTTPFSLGPVESRSHIILAPGQVRSAQCMWANSMPLKLAIFWGS